MSARIWTNIEDKMRGPEVIIKRSAFGFISRVYISFYVTGKENAQVELMHYVHVTRMKKVSGFSVIACSPAGVGSAPRADSQMRSLFNIGT
jgi:hypothetical protein